MNKFITNKKNNFTMIDNKLICNNKLSAKAKGVLIYLLSRPKEWYASVTDITKNFKDGTDAVKSALKELERFMYLERTKTRKPDGTFLTIYNVYESPDQHPKKQTTLLKEAIQSGKSTVDNPLVENPQINNKMVDNNTKKLNKKEIVFYDWWNLYSHKVNVDKCKTKFVTINEKDIEIIFAHTKEYVANSFVDSNKGYPARKNPMTYLNNQSWLDPITPKKTNQIDREKELYDEAEAKMHKQIEKQRKEWAEAEKNSATNEEIREALSGFKKR